MRFVITEKQQKFFSVAANAFNDMNSLDLINSNLSICLNFLLAFIRTVYETGIACVWW